GCPPRSPRPAQPCGAAPDHPAELPHAAWLRLLLRGRLTGYDTGDLGACHDQARVLAALDRDPVVREMDDRADDAAIRDDLIVALELVDHFAVPLLRLALRPDEQEPENQRERRDLDRDGKAGAAA